MSKLTENNIILSGLMMSISTALEDLHNSTDDRWIWHLKTQKLLDIFADNCIQIGREAIKEEVWTNAFEYNTDRLYYQGMIEKSRSEIKEILKNHE